jgi:prepilin-type processing-associated H-X9-DG protein
MNPNLHPVSRARLQSERAFTRLELLVILVVVALLLTLRLSALAATKDQTLRGQCAGHLRQIALTTTILATDNGDKLPVNINGNWAWDMSGNVGNTYTNFMPLQNMYCPGSGFNYDDNNGLWGYAGGQIHVIGYGQTLPGTLAVASSNYNATLTPQRIQAGVILLPAPLASQRVLFADATISSFGQSDPTQVSKYQWTDIAGGFPKHHRTSHMDGALPVGGNLAMLDGHVEWRSFPQMLPRTVSSVNGVADPVFWW